MDRHERAEAVVRLVGLAALVRGGAGLVFAVVYIALVSRGATSAGMWVIAECGGPALEALLGMGLLAGAGAVAELLVPRGRESEWPSVAEMVGLGAFALAVYFFLGALTHVVWLAAETARTVAVSGVPRRSGLLARGLLQPFRPYLVRAATGGLVAAVLLAGGQLLTLRGPAWRWMARRLSPARALGTGFALAGILIAGRTAVVYTYQQAHPQRLGRASAFGGAAYGTLIWQDVDTVLRLVEVLVILLLCARAGRWLAGGAPKGSRPVLAALAGLLLWSMLTLTAWLRVLSAWAPAKPLGSTAQWGMAGAMPVLTVAVMVAAGRWGPGVAHGDAEGTAGGATDPGAALIAVEVALTVAVLVQLFGTEWALEKALFSPLPMLLTIALALVLRGDVARWCVRGVAEGADDLRERRRAALYPALSFLGFLMTLGCARIALMAILTSAGGLPAERVQLAGYWPGVLAGPMPYVHVAGAVVLLLARRRLAMLLSYGPLLHRRPGAGGGPESALES